MTSIFNRLRTWLFTPPHATQAAATDFYEVNAAEHATHDARAHLVPFDENLLERSRTQWQFGDWSSLARLDRDTLQHHPDRAKLALLAAAGRLQTGQDAEAKQWIRLAQDWGCSKKLISQILIAGAHNSIGRAAALSGQQARSLQHFEAAINTGTPGGDVKLLSQARSFQQLEQLDITNNALLPARARSKDVKINGLVGSNNHIIISGTGRSGTTFLVQILTTLGFDTGFKDGAYKLDENCNAGLEIALTSPLAPYIVKDPRICDYLDDAIQVHGKVIEHAIIPVRQLYAAAESRRDVQRRSKSDKYTWGGLWDVKSPAEQENVLAHKLYKLINALATHEIPVTFLEYPRFIEEPDYLYKMLSEILPIDKEALMLAYDNLVKKNLIHKYETPT